MRKKINALQGKHRIFKYISIYGLIGIPFGLTGGYLYYYYVGCQGGSCPITSNPYLSLLWGSILGYLLGDMFKTNKKSNTEKELE